MILRNGYCPNGCCFNFSIMWPDDMTPRPLAFCDQCGQAIVFPDPKPSIELLLPVGTTPEDVLGYFGKQFKSEDSR